MSNYKNMTKCISMRVNYTRAESASLLVVKHRFVLLALKHQHNEHNNLITFPLYFVLKLKKILILNENDKKPYLNVPSKGILPMLPNFVSRSSMATHTRVTSDFAGSRSLNCLFGSHGVILLSLSLI